MKDLISTLNEEKLSDVKVEWYWDFKGNDVIDTINGKYLDTYYFEIALTLIK